MPHTHDIFCDYDLSNQNTMALRCVADRAIILHNKNALPTLSLTAPWLVLSGGSNVLLPARLRATVILPRFLGIEIIEETAEHIIVEVAAGENWHDFVSHCVEQGWYGLENLALIPGLVGASPVQNIGAYGVQLEDALEQVEVFEWQSQSFQTLNKAQCQFRYRHSIFKDFPNRYLISAVRFRLHKDKTRTQTNYGDLHEQATQFAKRENRAHITPKDVYQAVIAIRSSKLPDPKVLANCGSFFQNPIIEIEQYQQLIAHYPQLPSYPVSQTHIKIPAGWLIDQAGLKGGGIAPILTHKKQALVLTNHAPLQATQDDILTAQQFIIDTVFAKFGVQLTPEPVWINDDGSYR